MSNYAPASSKEFLDIQATIECGFTLKRMTKTYSQIHRTYKYSEYSSIIWPVWLNRWVFVYELSGSGFEPSFSHLNFRFHARFRQGVPWHSGNCVHDITRTYSQIHSTDKYSEYSSIIWIIWLNGWAFVYDLSSSVFESSCCHLKSHHFHTKLPFQKAVLMQIEWRVQNEPFTKNWVLSVTTSFFWKFCFSLRTSYQELIWCTNHTNADIPTFWRCFFPESIHKPNQNLLDRA